MRLRRALILEILKLDFKSAGLKEIHFIDLQLPMNFIQI